MYETLLHLCASWLGLIRTKQRVLPEEAKTNPDKYINPGDIICTKFISSAVHVAIYIGNSQVVHVSGHGGKVSEAKARIGDFSQHFVSKDDNILVMDCLFRFREAEKIVDIAKDYAENEFRKGKYNLLSRNCQHFVTRCAFGLEVSFDMAVVKTAIRLVTPFMSL